MRWNRSMFSRHHAVLLSLLVGAAACSDPTGTSPAYFEARSRWASTAPASYEVTVTVGCFCPPPYSATILVTNDSVVSAHDPATGAALSLAEARRYPTVIMLFDQIARATATSGAEVHAEYDTSYGFPRQVSINTAPGALDSGVGYTLTEFHGR
jgi:hypothetical protein